MPSETTYDIRRGMMIDRLKKRRPITIQDLLVKAENEDWHGVADAAMDLREIDAQLKALNA
jgi:hypothetical protein